MNKTVELLGDKAEYLLSHTCKTIDKSTLHLPSPHTVEEVWAASDRNIPTLNSLQRLLGHGRLGGTGYVSILPVDQGIEHTAGASFAPNPIYFDPENIVRLAIEGGCNGVASTLGVLGAVARRYAHKIPFVVKINHNELLTYPNNYDQVLFGSVEQAWEMGAVAVGATIYFVGRKPPSAHGDRGRLRTCPRPGHGDHPCGAICATTPSRRTVSTTTAPPT